MYKHIRISRVIINILFYIFYVLLASVIFSFVFPLTLKISGKSVLNPSDPIFVKIQLAIIVLVLVATVIYRRFFYLPIRNGDLLNEEKNPKKELELEHDMNQKENSSVDKPSEKLKYDKNKGVELDIKIGREK
ncbi:MAG: hypothetical protein PHH06_05460 [Candidatus Gracilibacteria bacterium]|nr:hypothetical protein [Candidatus Gracilibacteria bacterium]